jgi:hypothetical protein
MIRITCFLIALFSWVNSYGSSLVPVRNGEIVWASMEAKIIEQCGLSMTVPRLLDVFDQPIGFGCSGSYKGGKTASLNMGYEYNPNNGSGGTNIGFEVQDIGIAEKMATHGDSIFKNTSNGSLPRLWNGVAYGVSNCGTPTTVKIAPISSENWHGWIAEESFGNASKGCKLVKEYTPAYRCVHLMIGNEKMVAQLGGVCLLRKKELSLEHGFSYDLFIDMVKSIHFNEN